MNTIENVTDINLIRKIAWSYYKTTGIDYEELFSEALLASCEADVSYKSNMKAKKSTYMWCYMNSKLAGFIYNQKRQANYMYMDDINYTPLCINTNNTYKEFLKTIPQECKELINEIVKNPHKYESINTKGEHFIKPKLARGILFRSLRKKGWSNGKIWRNIRYMKENINKI